MIKKNRHAYIFSIKSKNGRKIYRCINLMTGCEFLPLAIECKQYEMVIICLLHQILDGPVL